MPFPDSLKAIVAVHAVRDFAELAEEAMRGQRWEAALGLTEHVPSATVMKLLAQCSHPMGPRRQFGSRLFDRPAPSFSTPSFLDDWVVGLLEAGVDPATPLQGPLQLNDQSLSWAGTVHTFAMLMRLSKTWDWLAQRESSLASWEKLPVTLGGETTTLLHAAVATDHWHWAKALVEGGFSPYLADAQGALPWEKISPNDIEAQTKVLDPLGLWPRNADELRRGWDRRGLGAGHARKLDLDLRTHMGQRLNSGHAFEMMSTIDRLLRLRRASDYKYFQVSIPPAAVDLWKACDEKERQRA